MAQLWYIVVPENSTNLVKNPSAERTGNYSVTGTSLVALSNAWAFSGFYSYLCDINGTEYAQFNCATMANADHTVSLSVKATVLTNWQISVDGTNYVNLSSFTLWEGAITDANGARYYYTFPAAQCNGATYIRLKYNANIAIQGSIYVDALQVEQTAYPTTYIDCDIQGCYANGERHASSSFRSAQERSGGRVYNFETYSATVSPASNRFGAAPIVNNYQALALQPGAEYLGKRELPREVSLTISLSGTSLENLHALRAAFNAVTQPDAVRDEQPFILGYQGANSVRRAWGKFRYVSGWEFQGSEGFLETLTLRFIAVDPYWYEWGVVTQQLVFTQTLSSPRFTRRRRAGEWAEISLSGATYTQAYDYERGRVYVGGAFTTGNGGATTLNRVAYWDGSQLVAMGTGPGISANNVLCSAVAPNGHVWFGGTFSNVVISSFLTPTDKLAKYNPNADEWTAYSFGSGTITEISGIAFDASGNLYLAGDFVNVGGANGDNIIKYDGTTVTALSTGANGRCQNVIVASDGTVYVTSNTATSMGGVSGSYIWSWDGSAFLALPFTGTVSPNLGMIFEGEDGMIYFAGRYDIWRWNGTSLVELADFGANDIISFTPYKNNTALVSLNSAVTTFGSDYHLIWNGTSLTPPDFKCDGNNQIRTLAIQPNTEERNEPEIFAVHNSAFTHYVGDTTTVTSTSTAKTFPVFLVTGPTSGSCRIQFLQNVSTGETIYLSLKINAGEYAIIDCRSGVKGVFSAWSGRPGGSGVFTRSTGLTGEGLNAGAGRRVNDQPLPASDFASFHLLPGSNIIGAFISGTTTGVTLTMAYQPQHLSVDGVA